MDMTYGVSVWLLDITCLTNAKQTLSKEYIKTEKPCPYHFHYQKKKKVHIYFSVHAISRKTLPRKSLSHKDKKVSITLICFN